MDKVQKNNSFNTNTPSSESYRNYLTNHLKVGLVFLKINYYPFNDVETNITK
jgi:hypothetical protein